MTLIAGARERAPVAPPPSATPSPTGSQRRRHSQGGEMLAMALVVCAGVGLVAAAIGLAARHRLTGSRRDRGRRPRRGRGGRHRLRDRRAGARGAPGEISDRWDSSRSRAAPTAPRASPAPAATAATSTGRRLVDAARGRPADRDRARDVRVLVGARGHADRLRARRPLALLRDARRARLRRLAADHRPDVGRARLGRRAMSRRRPGAGARCSPPRPPAAPCSSWPPRIDWVWELAGDPGRLPPARRVARRRRAPPRRRPAIGASACARARRARRSPAWSRSRSRSRVRLHARQPGPAGRPSSARRSTRPPQPRTSSRTRRRRSCRRRSSRAGRRPRPGRARPREATDKEPTNWRNWLVLSRLEAAHGNVRRRGRRLPPGARLNPDPLVRMNERGEPTDVRGPARPRRVREPPSGRPVPRAGFRGDLRPRLVARSPPRLDGPRRLRLLIAAHAVSGAAPGGRRGRRRRLRARWRRSGRARPGGLRSVAHRGAFARRSSLPACGAGSARGSAGRWRARGR